MKKTKKFEWNQVTPLSKYLVMALFITLPFIGFWLGMQYQKQLLFTTNQNVNSNQTNDWKIYSNKQDNYSFQYPSGWIIRPNSSKTQQNIVTFENKEFEDSSTTNIDRVWGSIEKLTGDEYCGLSCVKMTESQFFDKTNPRWKVGNIGGGGPGITVKSVDEVFVGGKRAFVTVSHPTTDYEWSTTKDLTYTYYVFLGGQDSNILKIEFNINKNNPQLTSYQTLFDQLIASFQFK